MQEPQRRPLSLMWILQSHRPLLCQRAAWCMCGTERDRIIKHVKKCKTKHIWFRQTQCGNEDCCAHLSVHEDIDNWVVDGGALGKVCRHGSSQRMEGISRVCRGKAGKKCVRSPADNICHDHYNDHSGYFPLSFLGWLWFLLLHGNLWLTNQHSVRFCQTDVNFI